MILPLNWRFIVQNSFSMFPDSRVSKSLQSWKVESPCCHSASLNSFITVNLFFVWITNVLNLVIIKQRYFHILILCNHTWRHSLIIQNLVQFRLFRLNHLELINDSYRETNWCFCSVWFYLFLILLFIIWINSWWFNIFCLSMVITVLKLNLLLLFYTFLNSIFFASAWNWQILFFINFVVKQIFEKCRKCFRK